MGRDVPDTPKLFLKPPSSLIASGQAIRLPAGVGRVDYEGELAVIIGRQARHIQPHEVDEYVLGYSLLNDVTARELQRKDVQFTRAKGFDTFCPVGPVVVTGLEPTNLIIKTCVDGELRQHSNTSDMVFDVRTLVSFISRVMTLLPGDIVSTGTPSGVAPLRQGERVTVSIPEIGVLENVVEAE
jgi:2-keto-4-pentenoate hydratase/2-oxohepta-3-ene-1,7-dioic acid hydratase in catechol pathway